MAQTIKVRVVADPPGLVIEAGSLSKEVSLPGLRRLPTIRKKLPGLLRGVRRAVGLNDVKLSDADLDLALQQLDLCAHALALDLLRGTEPQVTVPAFENDLAQFISPALRAAGDTPIIELIPPPETDDGRPAGDDPAESMDWILPLEFLRIAEPAPSVPGPISPARRLGRFLGMRAIVVRRMRSPVGPSTIGAQKVPITVLAYDGKKLTGPQRQAAFFADYRDFFEDRHWPRGQTLPLDTRSARDPRPYIEAVVATQLADQMLTAADLDQADAYTGAILHFACHYCSAEIAGLDQTAPFLSFDDFCKNVSVSMLEGAISLGDEERSRYSSKPAPSLSERFARMFVFVNACESASKDLLGSGMLSMLFSRGFRHVVASETLLPDALAYEFASRFYIGLRRGLGLGEAVLQARRDLVERCDNPGGMFYTLYGDPGLKLARN